MKIINISQAIVSKIINQAERTNTKNDTERRIHADRRKEPRFGDVVDRRKQSNQVYFC